MPSARELHALVDTFGVLTVFYAAKNFSYILIQVTERWVVAGFLDPWHSDREMGHFRLAILGACPCPATLSGAAVLLLLGQACP